MHYTAGIQTRITTKQKQEQKRNEWLSQMSTWLVVRLVAAHFFSNQFKIRIIIVIVIN